MKQESSADLPAGQLEPTPKSGLWRLPVLLGAVIALIILARVLNLGQYVASLREWIDSLGPLGPVVFIVIYAIAVAAAIPGSAMTLAAGALFGSALGIVVVSVAATLGAGLAFLAARYFARNSVQTWLKGRQTFQRLDEMTERHGAVIVALTRLVPLFPFNLLNYGFGLTRVPFWTYLFWSWLCMLPGTILYVLGADAVSRAVAGGEIPWSLIIMLAAAAIALGFLVRFAKRRLHRKEEEV